MSPLSKVTFDQTVNTPKPDPIDRVKMIAVATLGVAMATSICVFAPAAAFPISLIFSYAVIRNSYSGMRHFPDEFLAQIKKIQLTFCKIVGFFSKTMRSAAARMEARLGLEKESITVKKVAMAILGLIAAGACVASFVVAPSFAVPFSLISIGIGIYRNYDAIVSCLFFKKTF